MSIFLTKGKYCDEVINLNWKRQVKQKMKWKIGNKYAYVTCVDLLTLIVLYDIIFYMYVLIGYLWTIKPDENAKKSKR